MIFFTHMGYIFTMTSHREKNLERIDLAMNQYNQKCINMKQLVRSNSNIVKHWSATYEYLLYKKQLIPKKILLVNFNREFISDNYLIAFLNSSYFKLNHFECLGENKISKP